MKFKNNIERALLLLLLAAVSSSVLGANTDSLSLQSVINEVIQNHPLVKKSMEEINSSDARVMGAKAGYLPNAEFAASYTRIGPVSEITLPGAGSFEMMPKDNYSASISINQSLYDFGRTSSSIKTEKQSRELSLQGVEQTKQKLSQAVIGSFYTLAYLQEAIKIKEEQLNTLKEHLAYVLKKQKSGSATQYEVLTTEVRISGIENQKIDLENARQIQVSTLNSLRGKPESTPEVVKSEVDIVLPEMQSDALIANAMVQRDEMKIAHEKAKLTALRYELTKTQNNASLIAFASGGVKNGYFPGLYDPTLNYAAGVTFKVPLFDGKRTKSNLLQVKSAINSNDQETESIRRNIVNEVVEYRIGVQNAQKKVDLSQLQYKQAAEAYSLAKIRFESGVITNLELLDGSTALSESRLMLLKSRIDFVTSVYKLKLAAGERLY